MKHVAPVMSAANGDEGRAPVERTGRSHGAAEKPRSKPPIFDAVALQQNLFWTVPETAFMCRVGVRTVWRELSDPESKFPRARRIRCRTLLPRDEVLAYLAKETAR